MAGGIPFLSLFVRLPRLRHEYAMRCGFAVRMKFHETWHLVTLCFMKKDSKRCCDTTTPESIHTKDESKRGSAFAFIFGVN